jgi:hypothetical protein
MICSLHFFNQTIIDWKIPFIIWVSIGLCVTPITYSLLKEPNKNSEVHWQFGVDCLTFGSIVVFCFLYANNVLLSSQVYSKKYAIMKSGMYYKKGGGCSNKYFVIDIDGLEKTIEFDCNTQLEKSNEISLIIQKGCLGYNVIVAKKVVYN